jgi:hypothetical protein
MIPSDRETFCFAGVQILTEFTELSELSKFFQPEILLILLILSKPLPLPLGPSA